MDSTHQPQLFPDYPRFQPVENAIGDQSAAKPARIGLHATLLAITALTTTFTGAIWYLQTNGLTDGMFIGPLLTMIGDATRGNFNAITQGLVFTFTLLSILAAHELGHYFACRYYGIQATLPFFIPAPPFITAFGTFGAVIKIKDPIYSRKALFDIGIAGPLAGFAFALPASVVGLLFATPAKPVLDAGGIQFLDPLGFQIITRLLGLPAWIEWNPIYWAAWGSLLVTALNLFPAGQLDGGHVVYALFGRRWHKAITLFTCAAVGILGVYSLFAGHPPVYGLWTVVLIVLALAGHPPVADEEPLGAGRWLVAALAVLVFLFCFLPFPIKTT